MEFSFCRTWTHSNYRKLGPCHARSVSNLRARLTTHLGKSHERLSNIFMSARNQNIEVIIQLVKCSHFCTHRRDMWSWYVYHTLYSHTSSVSIRKIHYIRCTHKSAPCTPGLPIKIPPKIRGLHQRTPLHQVTPQSAH